MHDLVDEHLFYFFYFDDWNFTIFVNCWLGNPCRQKSIPIAQTILVDQPHSFFQSLLRVAAPFVGHNQAQLMFKEKLTIDLACTRREQCKGPNGNCERLLIHSCKIYHKWNSEHCVHYYILNNDWKWISAPYKIPYFEFKHLGQFHS